MWLVCGLWLGSETRGRRCGRLLDCGMRRPADDGEPPLSCIGPRTADLAASVAEHSEVDKDKVEARSLLSLAAERGNSNAQYNVALMLAEGESGQVNQVEARRLLHLAADQGHALSQRLLASLAGDGGQSTPQDTKVAAPPSPAGLMGSAACAQKPAPGFRFGDLPDSDPCSSASASSAGSAMSGAPSMAATLTSCKVPSSLRELLRDQLLTACQSGDLPFVQMCAFSAARVPAPPPSLPTTHPAVPYH